MCMKDIFVLGTDARFDVLSQLFEQDGHRVFRSLSFPVPEGAVVLFSLGAGEEEVLPVLKKLAKSSFVFVGRKTEEMVRLALQRELFLFALLQEEEYVLENSLATAEGCLAEVIQKTDCLLSELVVLICGYGNCGRALARLFWLCGAGVWIFSREGSLEKARHDGFNIYRAPGKNMGMFDVVLNTVPAPILTEEFTWSMREGSAIFQVASGTSGADRKALSAQGIRFHPLPGLPGRFAPQTEANCLYRIVNRALSGTEQESE